MFARLVFILAALMVACARPPADEALTATGVPLPRADASRIKIFGWGQSNWPGQAAAGVELRSVPYYPRLEDEYDGAPGLFIPVGPVRRDRAVPAADIPALGTIDPKYGSQIQLARALEAAGRHPVIFGVSRSGTPISHWVSDETGRAYFDKIARQAISLCGRGQWHFIIHHGESDAGSKRASDDYEQNLLDWIEHVRDVLGSDTRVYVLAVNSNFTMLRFRDTVRLAQRHAVESIENAELQYADDVSRFPIAQPHYTAEGYDAVGAMWATRILSEPKTAPE